MTLLITIFAAVISTLVWYLKPAMRDLKVGLLCQMFWGASLMWTVDAVFGFAEDGAAFFTPSGAEMLNDAFLGFAVIALALLIWVAVLLIKDPRGTLRSVLSGK